MFLLLMLKIHYGKINVILIYKKYFMTDKYYTPSIEDIRVGYEVESHEWCIDEIGTPERNYDRWTTKILDKSHVETILKYGIKGIRVPCLTKEQIEAEGWSIVDISKQWGDKPSYKEAFEKGNYFLGLDTRKPHIEIIAKDVTLIDFLPEFPERFRITIPCPSINEFRIICKLLNI